MLSPPALARWHTFAVSCALRARCYPAYFAQNRVRRGTPVWPDHNRSTISAKGHTLNTPTANAIGGKAKGRVTNRERMDAAGNEGQGANPMGGVRVQPCRHLIQNPCPAHPPNGIGERHILHLSARGAGTPARDPRVLMLRTS